MGSVVGENILQLIKYTANRSLTVIMVRASRVECMQDGSLSLIQMSKIYYASNDYQFN